MAITRQSMVLEVLDSHPKTLEVFKKYGLGQIEDPSIRAMAAGANFETAFSFVGLAADQQEAMLKDLNEAAES
ncbi:MAG TPA: DUF1858 domain-containing protein [Dehalococcoidia bacterium]|jgi:hypothetical protein